MPNQSIQNRQVNLTSTAPLTLKQNHSRRFQNLWGQWGYQSGGQIVPDQGYPSQMTAIKISQLGGQVGSRFRNQDDPGYHPQMRGKVNPSHIQYARNPSQWGRQEHLQFESQDGSEYPHMRGEVKPNQIQYPGNPFQWGRQEAPQLRSQSDPEFPQVQYQMNPSQLRHKGGPLFWSQDSKENTHSQTKNYEVYLRKGTTRAKKKNVTDWSEWMPPHKYKYGRTKRTATTDVHGLTEDEIESESEDDSEKYNPNHPGYNLNASVSAL